MLLYVNVPFATTASVCPAPATAFNPTAPLLTTIGVNDAPNWLNVNVNVLPKLLNPPPGSTYGSIVKSAVVEVLLGNTDHAVFVVATIPPVLVPGVILAPPEVYILAEPAVEPVTLNDVNVIAPEAVADVLKDVPVAEASGWAVIASIAPPAPPTPEAFKAAPDRFPTDERYIEPPAPAAALTLMLLTDMLPPETALNAPPDVVPVADSARFADMPPEPKLVSITVPPLPAVALAVNDPRFVSDMLPDDVVA